jgi:hypothetical protein
LFTYVVHLARLHKMHPVKYQETMQDAQSNIPCATRD